MSMAKAKKSRVGRYKRDVSLSALRSAITNGSELLLECDHRTARMRRLRDLINAFVSDLGGEDSISEAQYCIVRRCAMLTLELELLETKFEQAEGSTLRELEAYQRSANSLSRLLKMLGLQRRAKDVTPSPLDYAEEALA